MSENKYIKFVEVFLKVAKRVLAPYSSKYSKKDFTQPQLLAINGLMKFDKKNYRSMPDFIEIAPEIKNKLKLKKIPHYTTLHKFMQRIGTRVLDSALTATLTLFAFICSIIGIDATGYSLTNASTYYTQKIKGKAEIKKYLKNSIIVDTKTQAILASHYSLGPKHDNKDFKPLVQRVSKLIDFDVLVADKGYDSESNHKLVRRLGAETQIPVRDMGYNVRGEYRRLMKRTFDKKVYHRRSLVETVNFVKKQKFGDRIRARKKLMQRKEGLLTDVCYNLYRYVKVNSCFYWIGFLQGSKTVSFIYV